jgi:hypothetical protein
MRFMFMRTFTLLLALVAPAVAQSTIIGVLEDVPPFVAGARDRWAVRVVFEKKGTEWQAFPSNCPDEQCLSSVASEFPREVVWNISFDGKSLGKVAATTPKRFDYYAEVGLQKITSQGPIPFVGVRSSEFGGYTDAAVFRPLVANSEPFVTDPDLWRRSRLSAISSLRLRQQFRRHYGELCRLGEDQTTLKPFPYGEDTIRIVQVYTSRDGWAVARLHLEGAIDCQDTEAGFEIDDGWFVINPQGEVRYLDAGMWLVDAGDYDNGGHSELIFAINRDNRGGYELFYDGFKKRAVFEYTYH